MSGSVLYVPEDPRFKALQDTLKQSFGAAYQRRKTARVLEETKGLPPDERAEELIKQLGPRGATTAQSLLEIQLKGFLQQKAQQDLLRGQIELPGVMADTQRKQLELQQAPQLFEAELAQRRAAAGASAASAESSRANTAKTRQQIQQEALLFPHRMAQADADLGRTKADTTRTQTETSRTAQQMRQERERFPTEMDKLKADLARTLGETELLVEQTNKARFETATARIADQFAGRRLEAETSLKEAQVNESRARAAGMESEIRSREIATQLAQRELDRIKQMEPFVQGLLQELAPQPQNPVRPQNAPVETTPQMQPTPIATGAPATPSINPVTPAQVAPPPVVTANPPTRELTSGESTMDILRVQDEVRRGVDTTPPITERTLRDLPQGVRLQVAAAASKGDLATVGKLLQDSNIFTGRQEIEVRPGVKQVVGFRSDGSSVLIPGTRRLDTRPMDNTAQAVSTGAELWYNTSQGLASLSNAVREGKTSTDVLGGWVTRHINPVLIKMGLNPLGDNETRDTRLAYQTLLQHNILGIQQLMAGVRDTQRLRDQMSDLAAISTKTAEDRRERIRATDLTAKILIKSAVENEVAAGTSMSPGLVTLYKKMNLDKEDLNSLREKYLEAYRKLGYRVEDIDPLDDLKKGSRLDNQTPSQQYPNNTRSGGAGTTGLPPGWTIQRVN